MDSSDDESEAVPLAVTNYHFVDDKDEPISFSVLRIEWDEDDKLKSSKKQMFLHGTADSGLQKVYKRVTAWKLDLSEQQPEISLLSKDNSWIKLQKPRKSFEDTIRTILITVHCLHFARINFEASEKAVWEYLCKVFSSYEVRPSENDLLDHVPLIKAMVERDEELSRSKFLLAFLDEKPKKRKPSVEATQGSPTTKRSKFIVDDDEDVYGEDADASESDEEPDLFDSVCAICDNGGELLCCEGRCLRSFHATEDAGADSECKSLGMSKAQVKAIQNFLCANCQYKRHQCFACSKLGSSDRSGIPEVFPCVSATCGYFYHPECVAKLLHPGNEAEAEEHQKKIAAGDSFTCPIHKCLVCKLGENKEVEELQFAICRRCPKAYHRKCLPRKIAFEDLEDEDIIQRAWDDLIPNRILIYCLKHKIEEDIGTPIRNHIIFPEDPEKKKARPLDLQPGKAKSALKKKDLAPDQLPKEKSATKAVKRVDKGSIITKESDSAKTNEKLLTRVGSDLPKRLATPDTSRKPLKGSGKSILVKVEKPSTTDESRQFVREDKSPIYSKSKDISSSKKTISATSVIAKSGGQVSLVDAETEKRIMALIKKSASSISLEDVTEGKHRLPSTHSYSTKNIEKTITQGKVERFVEAVRTALQKLEDGCNIEDAKAVCEPEILSQIIKWKNKLKVYLAPFLHGMRYTSFGRHFTKVDKLKEIVDRLHWYVQNGDTIVDFCCGSNDFSILMRDKLQESGKQCFYRNFDVIQPKNDFNFEKRDWMTVRPRELPTGSQLIMGLNPPFGVKAALANKFIDKALEFKPKLLILIIPKETERLDEKKTAYDLIWEDGDRLSGKSFYLPGSVDVHDQQMEQWNVKPPMLYLWSRPDWTERHRAIAIKQGHISRAQETMPLVENHKESPALDHTEDDHDLYVGLSKIINDPPMQNDHADAPRESESALSEGMEISPSPSMKHDGQDVPMRHEDGSNIEGHETNRHRRERSHESRREKARKKRHSGDHVQLTDDGTPPTIGSPSKRSDSKSLLEGRELEVFKNPLERAGREDGFRQFDHSLSGSGTEFETAYGLRTSTPDEELRDIERRYSLNRDDPLASGPSRWPSSSTGLPSAIQDREQGLPGYIRDRSLATLSRNPYFDDLSVIDKYGQNAELQRQFQLYGPQSRPNELASRNQYSLDRNAGLGHLASFPSPFGPSSLLAEPSRMSSSVTQRYAPRLSETNIVRRPPFMPEMPALPVRGSIFDTVHGSRSGFHAETRGFAPGPQHPFPRQGSSGWLDE